MDFDNEGRAMTHIHSCDMTSQSLVRFGILGCANIARKNIRAIKLSHSAEIVAIASRDHGKCVLYATENDIYPAVTCYGSYDELVDDERVDAVYIPLPTTLHLEYAVKCARSGKHILLEKPLTVNMNELAAILSACKEKGVYFMDGTMFEHHPRLARLRSLLSDPFSGEVKRINSTFCFNGSKSDFISSDIRVQASGDPLGALGDLGWYCVRIALISLLKGRRVIGGELLPIFPLKVSCTSSKFSDGGVPLNCNACVVFSYGDKDIELTFSNSFIMPFRQSYELYLSSESFADKVITCDDFVIPRIPSSATFTVEASSGFPFADNACRVVSGVETVKVDTPSSDMQEVRMVQEFAEMIINRDDKLQEYFKDISVLNQYIVDLCYQSIKSGGQSIYVECSPLAIY